MMESCVIALRNLCIALVLLAFCGAASCTEESAGQSEQAINQPETNGEDQVAFEDAAAELFLVTSQPNSTPEMIIALIESGVEVNTRYKAGVTPLMIAALNNGSPEVIKALIDGGAEVNARAEDGQTPLTAAAWKNGNPEVVTALIEAGAEVNARGGGGKTPLMYAAWKNGNPEVITALLAHGADAKLKDADGNIALDFAKMNSHLKDSDGYWKLNDASF